MTFKDWWAAFYKEYIPSHDAKYRAEDAWKFKQEEIDVLNRKLNKCKEYFETLRVTNGALITDKTIVELALKEIFGEDNG